MKQVTLFQKDTKGKIKQWSCQVVQNKDNTATIAIEHGLQGGKMTPEETIISKGKNPGKANETTPYTQAVKDAESKIAGKLRKGYVEDITQVKASNVLGSGVKSPMLAEKFDPSKKQLKSKNLKDLNLEGIEVGVQRKKDGNRGKIIATRESTGLTSVQMYTRAGDLIPHEGLEHIVDSIRDSFDKSYSYYNKKYGITSYCFDGEFYTKAYSFNKLNGLVTKPTKTAEDLIDTAKIVYHLYDIELAVGYRTRYKIIQNFGSAAVHVEECIFIIASDKEITKYLEQFLEEGEEGLMIRQLDIPYENRRTWQLMKMKIFEDDEFEIVGFEESSKGGMVGAIWVKAPNGCFDKHGTPITKFKAGAKFDHELCKKWWNNQSNYIGKMATIEFFSKSEYGIPRFGKCKKDVRGK